MFANISSSRTLWFYHFSSIFGLYYQEQIVFKVFLDILLCNFKYFLFLQNQNFIKLSHLEGNFFSFWCFSTDYIFCFTCLFWEKLKIFLNFFNHFVNFVTISDILVTWFLLRSLWFGKQINDLLHFKALVRSVLIKGFKMWFLLNSFL